MEYIESYSELNKRISEIEGKSSYDLFVKLYGSNISLKNELEQINSRYIKLYELAFEKSEYVDQLYNIRKLLNKPEIKMLKLLSILDSRFPQSSIEQILMTASNKKYAKIDDIYFDYNSLIEVINKDKVNKQILNDWLAKKKNIHSLNKYYEKRIKGINRIITLIQSAYLDGKQIEKMLMLLDKCSGSELLLSYAKNPQIRTWI